MGAGGGKEGGEEGRGAGAKGLCGGQLGIQVGEEGCPTVGRPHTKDRPEEEG